MDAMTVGGALVALIPTLKPLVLAPVASLLTSAAEKAPGPYEGKSRAGIVAALTLASLALNVATAYASGNLATLDTAHIATVGIDSLATVLVAAGGYALTWAKARKGA